MMNTDQYLNKMKMIQSNLLDFLNNEENYEINFQELQEIFNNQSVQDNKNDLTSLFHLIAKISENCHRNPSFFKKIEQIISLFKLQIKQYYLNSEIFNIFKGNKRILLFLFEEKIIKMDEYIVESIIQPKFLKAKYPQYFSSEIRPFINKDWLNKNKNLINETTKKSIKFFYKEITKELPENFNELRKIGENENFICELIRNDSIDEFIIYANKHNISLRSEISRSIYETNPFFFRKSRSDDIVTLIYYAAFYGSFQIFKYLQLNNVELKPDLWFYAIHGNNPEIIHLLEANCIQNNRKSYKMCLKESILCHHNDFANYIVNSYLQIDEIYSNDVLTQGLKYYNFEFISDNIIKKKIWLCLECKYDYYSLAHLILQIGDIDMKTILELHLNYIQNYIFNEKILYLAIEKENIEIVKLLLTIDKLYTDMPSI